MLLFQLFQSLNSVNFHQLAILICHLLIGGKFQTVQILYNLNALDHNLLRNIKTICLNGITWTTIDIKHLETPEWNDTMQPNHYIQLIFIDSDVQSDQVNRSFSELPPNYYRLVVFYSKGNGFQQQEISNKTKIDSNSNNIGLFYDVNGEIKAHLLHDDFTLFHQAIDLKDLNESSIASTKVFEKVFGAREKMRKLGVFDLYCYDHVRPRSFVQLNFYYRMLRKYFFVALNMDFYEVSGVYCKSKNVRYFHLHRKIYHEICWEIGQTDSRAKNWVS